ncbi:PAS domain-containing sensor histidine kinase [Pantoea sp. Tr-811]|uniref:PAS domain-containing sensor histidine kinase n=1 Tax=Pantoea sp. Tr-811 TaxID=2608361 RepID=UPI0019663D7F|nr:PAS domain-containing sensor histidine kinase [Pantoea sp. Tr-811]
MPSDAPSAHELSLRQRIAELQEQLEEQRLKATCFELLSARMEEGFCVVELIKNAQGQFHDYRYLLTNGACLHHTAHPKKMGQTAREVIPDEVDGWLAYFAEVARTGRSVSFEKCLQATNRQLNLSVHRLEPAQLNRIAIHFTALRQGQPERDRLLERNEELSQRVDQAQANSKLLGELVDHSLANVFAADRSLRLLAINRTAQETFKRLRGFAPQVGDFIPQFLARYPDLMSRLEPVWPRLLAGEAFTETLAFGPENEMHHYEILYNPLRDAQQCIQGGYLFAYDITERVREQERLRETEQALRQSQKMEAVGQLTGGIAHDFNNLLGSIMAALEMAEQRQDQQRHEETARLIGVARHSAQRAASLVQRLLAFSRQQTLKPQAVDVHPLVSGMRDLINSSIDSSIEFVNETLPGQWLILVDPPQLESALLNLSLNARDAMPSGGLLRIASSNLTINPELARSLDMEPGDYLHIQVRDNGVGMTREIAQRAVDPFFSTKALGQGSGLGLSMVYGFMRQSGGQLHINSACGKGTEVDLYLPRHSADAPAQLPCPAQASAKPRPMANLRTVLVEDQDVLRQIICDVLEDCGHEVHDFADGHQALAALHAGLQPDLLITDIGLPGRLDGHQVAAEFRRLFSGLPTLFISGYSPASAMARAASSSLDDILFKPFELATLKQRIELLLEKNLP